MARVVGKYGVVRVGATPDVVGELRSWEYTETATEIDASVMGTGIGNVEAGVKRTSGSITVWWARVTGATDPAPDAGQLLLTVGATLAIELHPNGTGSGKPQLAGTGVVLEDAVTADLDGIVESTIRYGLQGEWAASSQA